MGVCLSCHLTDCVKAVKELISTDPLQGKSLTGLIRYWSSSWLWRRGVSNSLYIGSVAVRCSYHICTTTKSYRSTTTTTTILRPFFRDHPGQLVPEENFWILWCKRRLTEADTDHPAGRHFIRTNQCPPPPSPHHTEALNKLLLCLQTDVQYL